MRSGFGGLSDAETMTLYLASVDEAPTIIPASFSVPENSGIGTSCPITRAAPACLFRAGRASR